MNDSVPTWHRIHSSMSRPLEISREIRYEFYLLFMKPSLMRFMISGIDGSLLSL